MPAVDVTDALVHLTCIEGERTKRFNANKKVPEPLRIGGSLRWRQSDIELWQSMNCPDRATFETRKREV